MGEEQILGVTKLVNALLGKPVAALLALLHITPDNPQYPITNSFSMELLVVLLAVLFFLWLKPRISVDHPGPTQQTMELVITNPMGIGVKDLVDDIVGHGAERHIPIVATIGIFILFSNMISLVPGLGIAHGHNHGPAWIGSNRFLVLQRCWHREARRPALCQDAAGAHAQAVPNQHHHAGR